MDPAQHRAVAQTLFATIAALDNRGEGSVVASQSSVTLAGEGGLTYALFQLRYPDLHAQMGLCLRSDGSIIADNHPHSIARKARRAIASGRASVRVHLDSPQLEDRLAQAVGRAETIGISAVRSDFGGVA